jgi:hypothetical protein
MQLATRMRPAMAGAVCITRARQVQHRGEPRKPALESQTALSCLNLKTGFVVRGSLCLMALVEVMPAHTNRPTAIPGRVIRLGARRRIALTCRDEVLAAIDDLEAREGLDTFTVRQVAAEMLAAGSTYKKGTITKTIQRMRGEDGCTAAPDLERVDRTHFRLHPDPRPEANNPVNIEGREAVTDVISGDALPGITGLPATGITTEGTGTA